MIERLVRVFFIARKDMESYYSKPPLITWGLIMPAVLMLAVYMRSPGSYLSVAPGIVAMTLLFGNTSMAAIVVTFEKRSGTLERLLLAPISHRTVMLGKASSAAIYGIATSLVLTAGLVFLLGMPIRRPLSFAAGMVLGAAIFSLLGMVASVIVREVFEAMTLMNFFRFPLLFISGVFLPVEALPWWIKPFSLASPLTYVVEILRSSISGSSFFSTVWIPVLLAMVYLVGCWFGAGPAFYRYAKR